MRRVRTHPPPLLNLSPSAQDWPAALILAKFDAWAERGASVVWSDRAVQHYDQCLVAYANSWLDQVARPYTSAPPAESPIPARGWGDVEIPPELLEAAQIRRVT